MLITVKNRTNDTITLRGGGGPQPFRSVIERVAVQVRLAPLPPDDDGRIPVTGWNDGKSSAVAIPPGRSAWVQSNFLMRDCGSLQRDQAITVNRSITLTYDLGGGLHGTQPVAVESASIILTPGPLHPKVPINTIG